MLSEFRENASVFFSGEDFENVCSPLRQLSTVLQHRPTDNAPGLGSASTRYDAERVINGKF